VSSAIVIKVVGAIVLTSWAAGASTIRRLFPGPCRFIRTSPKYILKAKPDAKIGVLYQNDDYGKDCLKGLRADLVDTASQIVAEVCYEVVDPTIDSQIVQLKAAGADTLIEQSSAKATAQAIRKVDELNWAPLHIIGGSTASVETVLKPAGLEASKGTGHEPVPQATGRSRIGQ
jgi:ABC-type branched-subunit amino acid transport system substrate-binding protein